MNNKNLIEKLIECKNEINEKIPKKHLENTFWCPKNKDGDDNKPGFILYAYGGQVLRLYASGRAVYFSLFSEKYKDYLDKDVWEGVKNTYNSVKGNTGGSDERLKRLLKIKKSEWNVFLSAFENRAYPKSDSEKKDKDKHKHLERARETVIAHRNNSCIPDGIKIIEMESRMPFAGKKPDMIGVRVNKGQPVLCFIEYKCTKAAMNGNCRPVDHYLDIEKYYQYPFDYFEEFEKRLGEPVFLKGGISKVKREIVFLFSHIGNGNELTEKKVINSLQKMLDEIVNIRNGTASDVRVVIINDENSVIRDKDFLSVDEAIKKLKEKRSIR